MQHLRELSEKRTNVSSSIEIKKGVSELPHRTVHDGRDFCIRGLRQRVNVVAVPNARVVRMVQEPKGGMEGPSGLTRNLTYRLREDEGTVSACPRVRAASEARWFLIGVLRALPKTLW